MGSSSPLVGEESVDSYALHVGWVECNEAPQTQVTFMPKFL